VDFASGRVEFSNENSVVEAHGRAAILLVWASYGRPVGLRPYAGEYTTRTRPPTSEATPSADGVLSQLPRGAVADL
jgi:hypothetical protein